MFIATPFTEIEVGELDYRGFDFTSEPGKFDYNCDKLDVYSSIGWSNGSQTHSLISSHPEYTRKLQIQLPHRQRARQFLVRCLAASRLLCWAVLPARVLGGLISSKQRRISAMVAC